MNASLKDYRQFYAEEIGAVAGLRSRSLVKAFARVPREDFLGPGPWKLSSPDFGLSGGPSYRTSEDADPKHLCHNVAVAIDPERNLNNGHPSSLAAWLDALEIGEGQAVFHLGAGVGYFSAIVAEVVGASGRVLAMEVDADLAARARSNLAPWKNVEVLTGDGGEHDPGLMDVIFINAGVTHLRSVWLDRLRPGGRLLVPLTFDAGGGLGKGGMLLVKREGDAYPAHFAGFVMIYSCSSVRDPALNGSLMKLFGAGKLFSVRSLRRDVHPAEESCWLHRDGFCLSAMEPAS